VTTPTKLLWTATFEILANTLILILTDADYVRLFEANKNSLLI
jgi:hypothetical protein